MAGDLRLLACAQVLLLALWASAAVLPDPLSAQPQDERRVKALFLYNFAKFVDWPAAIGPGPICITVIGDDAFGELLESIVSGKTANGRAFMIRRSRAETVPKDCHIVFISASERRRTRSIMDALKGSNTLTVGETPGFADDGGIINFETVDDRVRFEINVGAAERARLKVSSQLLSLAKIIRQRGD